MAGSRRITVPVSKGLHCRECNEKDKPLLLQTLRARRGVFLAKRVVLITGASHGIGLEVARNLGRDAYLVDNADELRREWIEGKRSVGVTAGASAPEVLVQEVIDRLQAMGVGRVRELEGISEARLGRAMPLISPGSGMRPGDRAMSIRARCRIA